MLRKYSCLLSLPAMIPHFRTEAGRTPPPGCGSKLPPVGLLQPLPRGKPGEDLEDVDDHVQDPGAPVHLFPPRDPGGRRGGREADQAIQRRRRSWSGRTSHARWGQRPRIMNILFWFEGVKKQQSFESYLDTDGSKKQEAEIPNSYQGRNKKCN